MTSLRQLVRRIPLRGVFICFLVAYGIVPLAIGALVAVQQHGELLETQQRVNLAHSVESVSAGVEGRLQSAAQRLEQLAGGLLAIPDTGIGTELRAAWIDDLLQDFVLRNADLVDTRVTFVREGRDFAATRAATPVVEAVQQTLRDALADRQPIVRFLTVDRGEAPAAVITRLAQEAPGVAAHYGLAALVPLPLKADGEAKAYLIDRDGEILWAEEADRSAIRALRDSSLVRDFVQHPAVFVREYDAGTAGNPRLMVAEVSPVGDTGIAVVVQQPKAVAFGAARRIAQTTLLAALVMVVLALASAVAASQAVTAPIRRLAEASGEIAAGNFSARVPQRAFSRELSGLTASFSLMSGQLEEQIEQLRRAAEENRELFLGSVRALLAAVEAKEPYTRGHSERVAEYSRILSSRLGLHAELRERIWVAGLLHDVGKIGIEDRILNKGDILTDEEYEKIKRHTIIGAEILSSIEPLSYAVEVVRWHHERWNGQGYPDGLAGSAIPLPARIVSVADTFDAMTTQRVYQKSMTGEQAKTEIWGAAGRRFDPEVVSAFLVAYENGEIRAVDAEPDDPLPFSLPSETASESIGNDESAAGGDGSEAASAEPVRSGLSS